LSVDRSPGRERISVSRSSRTIPDNASTFFNDPKELAKIFAVSVGFHFFFFTRSIHDLE